MLKANFKTAFFITLVSTLILLAGCSTPEEKKADQIKEALSLSEDGSHAEALKILENLASQYPNDVEILSLIGNIYAAQEDHAMAAFFLEQAHLQSPEDTELLYQTYKSLDAANQPASHLLEKLAEQSPEAMTPELWVRLGQDRQAANQTQSALDAYLKGVDPEKSKPAPETAAAIGQLFAKLGNLPQAESWLEIAADSDDPEALTALFGLLEIKLRQKDWEGSETTFAQLDKQFPGAVDASQWTQARDELTKWRKAQDEMKAKLAKAEADKKAAEEAAAKAAAEAKVAAETAAKENESSETEVAEAAESAEGKAQVIADMEAAEAMADTPAIEIPNDETAEATTDESSSGKTIAYNPDIAIMPADPEITFEVDYTEAPLAEPTTYAIDNSATEESAPVAPVVEEALPMLEAPEPEPIRISEGPRTIEELLADAETAELDRDFKSAIRKYWAAISKENNRADIWNLLSRAYLVDGQLKNAETAALESVRLNPREVAYTLDYLRVAQRSKEPESFLAELETAYDRFPASPEITLSLARAYERIAKDNYTARNLYLRFVDIAPNHPLVPEAREAAARLR